MNTTPTVTDSLSSRGLGSAIRAIGLVTLALLVCVPPVSATTVSYQQDVGGYTGTEDTFLQSDSANAGTDNGAALQFGWDDDDPGGTGQDVYSLIKFTNIFGGGAGQIPLGSQITSATLYMTVFDVGDTGEVRNALIPWTESDTFNSFCAGSCDEGVEHGPLVATAPAGTAVEIGVNVTTSVQAWSDGTTNNGWFIRPIDGGNGGVDARSSEFGTVAARPWLEVVYDEGPPVVGNLIREPYLSLATPTSQTICWRSDVSSDSRVQYGLSSGSLTSEATDGAVVTDHCVNVTGLAPATQYWYNVGSTTAVQGGGTVEHYFWTHPTVGATTPFTFWAVGDGGNGTPDQITVMNAMLGEVGTGGPDLALYLGDIAYNSGTDTEFTNNYFTPYEPVIRNTVVWPTLGNHEGASTTSGDPGPSTGPYYEAFVLPQGAEAGGNPSGTEAYYSFDYGNVHFIALNSYNVNRASTGIMATWLNFDLLTTSQQWIVAYWHHPPYTRGTHNSDFEFELIEMREEILPILEAGGVDLVLTGHSHTYERSYLIDGSYDTPTPSFPTLESQGNIIDDGDGRVTGDGPYLKSPGPNANEGAVYVVAGHGGQPVGGSHGHPVMYFAENVKGSCLIDVDANTLSLRNVRITGIVSDDFTIQKGDLPPRVTATDPPKQAVIGTLPSIEVTFSTGVTGVDALDLTVNGSAATSVVPSGTDVYTFTGFATPGEGSVVVVLAAGGIADETNPGLLFAGDTWSYRIDTSPPAIEDEAPARGTSIGVLPTVIVNFTKPVFNVSAADLLVNGLPATSLSGNDGTAGPYIFSGFPEPDQGLVTVELLQNGIQDDQALLFAGDTWNYVLETRLVINEFLASNNTIIADEIGGFDDYLEIHNPGNSTIDMSGMYLTNELEDPTRYEIPAGVTIGPGEYLLFWCNPSTEGLGPLHTNFNLDKDAVTNQDIGLFDTAANGFAIIDGLTYTPQVSDISSGRFPDATNGIVTMPPTPEATNTIGCTVPADCSDLNGACTVGNCVGSVCVAEPANDGGVCEDGISCTSGETCSTGACQGGTSNCPVGESCNIVTDVCEVQAGPQAGDIIITGFIANPDPEWIELFNTTDQAISLENLDIITRLDIGTPNDTLEIEWQLSGLGLDQTGLTIAPYSFFLVGESATTPAPDLDVGAGGMDLATGEAGDTERAVSIEVTVEAVPIHMDYVLYGRHDGSDSTAVPPGDLPFDGVTFPRVEVCRVVTGTGAGSFGNEGALQRISQEDLHAGYAIEGYYTDEGSLGSGFPTGVWTASSHPVSTLTPRNSSSAAVPPPAGVCTADIDCDDLQFCNGAETCNLSTNLCESGTPVDCDDVVTCTVDSCNETTDSCDNLPDDLACDDFNICTDDSCDTVADCQNVNNTAPCEDGDLCTGPDLCAGGACTTGLPVDCDDLVSCTDDSCDSGTGCQNVDNCPVGETCNLGLDICEGTPAAPPLPIVLGDTWTYFKGTLEPTTPIGSLEWAQVGYDDSSWLSGPSGFGYGDISAPNTVWNDMDSDGPNPLNGTGYNSVYFRREFSIVNPAQVESLVLIVDYDDAFVAYINGVEVVRTAGLLAAGDGTPQGVPPTFGQLANFPVNTSPGGDQNHESSGGGGGNPAEAFDIGLGTTTPAPPAGVTTGTFVVYGGTLAGLLQAGNNVIAIHGHNVTSTSSDFVVVPTLTATFDTGCTIDGDCDDGEDCTDDTCNTGTGECVFTPNDLNACDDGNACTDDACSAGVCVGTPDDANLCTDTVACTDDACTAGACISTDNCTGGDVCNVGTGLCEAPLTLQAGDVIVSGFQPSGTDEWVELFNTTTSAIALDNLELVVRVDANGDGNATIDWQLPSGLLTGATIAPQGFFLLREGAGPPAGDLTGALDLATGEGGTRALSLELVIDGVHMDYLLYGRNDLEPGGTADVPPGDLAFDGVTFPRTEVIRSCAPLGAGQCSASPPNFSEGSVVRLTDTALYSGHDVEGFYTDETALSSGFPDGVWSSDHATPFVTDPRNSGSPTVPPPTGTPCTLDSECDDNDVCNGIETCNTGIGFCQSGTPLVCNDGNVCTDDSCDSIAGCQTTNNTDPCDDLNACTNADVCGAGVCLGVPISCDDGVSCTDDSCDIVLGCENVDNCPVGQTCNLGTDVCEAGPVIVTFQNDGTYTGTQDALIMESEPAVTHGTLTDTCPGTAPGPCDNFEWDADDPNTTNQQNIGLLRFDGIVGPGVGQVPQGATVSSATLTITAYDPSTAPPADIHIALVDWDQTTATWDNFGGEAGVQPDELGADVGDAPIANGTEVIDITAAVQGWVDDPASNFGLIFMPNNNNGVIVRSSEYAADPNLRPMLTVEYVDVGAVAEMTCSLSNATVPPNGSVGLDVFLASAGGDVDVRGFQTRIQIALTSGSGALSVPCPGGVFIDEARSDYIFFNETNDSSVTTCSLMRASASMLSGSTTVGATPVYLSEYTLEVDAGATTGTTFEISFVPTPGSRLADENAQELPLNFGPVCTLTVEGCVLDSNCDDGNPCTTDTCNAGSCEYAPIDCSVADDQCNVGVCNPGTGLCEPQPANEGVACDDLDACTVSDVCTGGVCGGPPLNCSDGTICTTDTCAAGLCVYSPSGLCSIEGDVFYYRDNTAGGFEPSAKEVPDVEIDVNQDTLADATSTASGYVVAGVGSPVLVETLDKFGATTIADDNGAVTSFDATFIAQHAVNIGIPLSANQLVAGDVSGNGTVSSFDAAQVAQFAVDLLPGNHFQIAFDNGTDWAFFRCDNYVDASNQDCGPPSYLHDPLLGSALDDDFYAVLYGDVTGNWLPAARAQAGPDDRADPEAAARDRDLAFADRLRDDGWSERLALLQQLPSGVLLPDVELQIVLKSIEVVDGATRQTYRVEMHRGDGIQGLDLEIVYAPERVRVIDARTGDAAADFNLLSNDLQGTHKIGLYGVLPLKGTGTVVELVVEIAEGGDGRPPFSVSALANEQRIPVRMRGAEALLAPEPAKRRVRQVD